MILGVLFVAFLLYAALAEYFIHRYWMHAPFGPSIRLFYWHAIRHHNAGDNSVNVDIPVWQCALVALPWLVAFAFLSPWLLAAGCGAVVFYSRLWTRVHRAIHGLERNWAERLPTYAAWRRHHEGHHERPGRNFGTLFIFTDRLFGTAIAPISDGPNTRSNRAGPYGDGPI